ncbi:MAG: Ppx/GppA family phosphatase [Pseudomonadota bacterium]|nr:Ppx/GppA family phosphatase [Pseudomonadota bacterium]
MATALLRRVLPRGEPGPADTRTAIIDIGSNSIRLVVYQGHPRLPAILFNEKVMAGLGRKLAETGAIDAAALASAKVALARFAAVAHEMEARVRTVATAAVRDASNGQALIDEAHRHGLSVELLSGEQEAVAAGQGVLSAIPEADGIVGDLGGGSLELVRVVAGTITDRVSFPLGVLRIAALRKDRGRVFERKVTRMIREAGWQGRGRGLPMYLVGGSWRALARLDIGLTDYPLAIIHGYALDATTVARLGRTIAHLSKPRLRSIPGLSSSRAATLGDANALLGLVMRALGSERAIVSSFGLREGLLYGTLDDETRRLDPLIVGAREEGRLLGRFPEHGDLLDHWIAPLFADESAEEARIRHAACLLADVGWHANPEFRAERGAEIALHGNWVGITAAERAVMAQALFTSLGGGAAIMAAVSRLADAPGLDRAVRWGLAIRLGQRLSAGLAGPLQRSRIAIDGNRLVLHLAEDDAALYSEASEKRHAALANAMGLRAGRAA